MFHSMENVTAFISMPGGWEWIVVLVIALLIFGKRLPDVARGLGKSLTEFKKGVKDVEKAKDEVTKEVNNIKDDIVKETKDAINDQDSEEQQG
ncbi:MAG: twin-arginine translocase TatA/TatE family subunit [Phycisphaerae bacterium]|nr:twin-arginine translocase TatA/TatE family subunit [Phycisphaerae bacterium]